MRTTHIQRQLCNGEGLSVEFKRCSGRIEHDVFETVCAFLNRFGGDLLLGVERGLQSAERKSYKWRNENLTSGMFLIDSVSEKC